MKDSNTKTKKSSFLIWAIVAVVAAALGVMIALTICRKRSAAQAAGPDHAEVQQRTVKVAVMRVQPRRVPDVVELPAMVEAFAVADLAAERGGLVVEIPVAKGERVSAGDLMLRLDSRMPEQALRQAEILSREADREFERWQRLKQTGAVSESDFDAVRKARDLAGVALEQAKVYLSQCEVRAPMDGIVDARHLEVGEYVSEAQPVFRVVNVDRLKLAMDIAELDAAAVEIGKSVRFQVPAAGDREYTGKISFVAAMADAGSNSFRTEILVDDADAVLKPGMIANVSLVRRVLEAIVVPLSAVVPRKGQHVVFTVSDGHAVRHEVEIGSITGKEAVLAAGISAGDRIVVAGQRTLQDGAPVEVEERTESR